MPLSELKTARLTILIDPTTKRSFDDKCRDIDMTPSQVVRRLIREFLGPKERSQPKARPKPTRRR